MQRANHREVRVARSACRAQRGGRMSAENIAGLIVAVALVGYLILALIYPEKF
ncbi:hypothetical protein GCM10010502_71810 [Kitasatospora aureofaciens]|uniref:K(+)-transporting ATPase subunit F n=2 Tax=Kitasatospora aureofaciens TaxID=1894 RepID=A0A8H9HZX2_KITAU|nr:hypothetical protein GCM10010502_71810 [Kitasatospora aureofaciens]